MHAKRFVSVFAVTVGLTTTVGLPIVITSPAGAADTSVAPAPMDLASVKAALSAYATEVSHVMSSEEPASATTLGQRKLSSLAGQEFAGIAESMRQAGDFVKDATVNYVVKSAVPDPAVSGNVTVNVDITTDMHLADDGSNNPDESSFTEPYVLTLAASGSGYIVTKQEDIGGSSPGPAGVRPPLPPSDATPPAGVVPAIQPVRDIPTEPANKVYPLNVQGKEGVTATATTAGFPTENPVSSPAFKAYARKWTASPYNGDAKSDLNSVYPYYGDTNCANFASQTLDNSGWYLTGGNSLQAGDNTKWTYNLGGILHASHAWSVAANLAVFANNTGTYGYRSSIYDTNAGDLLFTDWDPNGHADGSIDHVMLVTGRNSAGMPHISQKSPNRNNIALSTSIALAASQGKTSIVWYGMKNL